MYFADSLKVYITFW